VTTRLVYTVAATVHFVVRSLAASFVKAKRIINNDDVIIVTKLQMIDNSLGCLTSAAGIIVQLHNRE